jgi:WXG100 family type VII secretion target
VEADYDQLTQVASRFAAQAQATEQTISRVQSSMSNLEDGGWIGRGSDAFFSEMHQEILPALQRLRQALEEANRVTNQITQTMQQAEEDASARFGMMA